MNLHTRDSMLARQGARAAHLVGLVLLWMALGVPAVGQGQPSTILVETNVSDAAILVDSTNVGRTNADGEALIDSLAAGTHTVKLRKDGYWTASSQVTLEPGLTSTVSLTLTARPTQKKGRLRVQTNVPDALVLVDGQKVGKTGPDSTISARGLSAGSHEVVILKDGYAETTRTVTLKESNLNQTLTVQLAATASDEPTADSVGLTAQSDSTRRESTSKKTPERARLMIDVGVPNAMVRLNDSTTGRTDPNGLFALQTKPGTHRIVVEKEGFNTTQKTAHLYAGEQRSLAINMTRISSEGASLLGLSGYRLYLMMGFLIGLASLSVLFFTMQHGSPRLPWKQKKFDRYDVRSVLRRSEFSTVYLAHDAQHGEVSLTVLDDPYAEDPDHVGPFLRKAHTLKKLCETDPEAPVIEVYRVGQENDEDDGRPFVAVEHLQGDTLLSHLKEIDTLDTKSALAITRQICAGLKVAHENDVHHGHLTPENIIVTQQAPEYKIKLVGFGLNQATSAASDTLGDEFGSGTSSYLAPEQLRDGRSDWRSDVYSTGIIFYKLVTGAAPHAGETSIQVLERQAEDPKPDLPDHIPKHVKPVFHRMISYDPDQRPTPSRVLSVLDLLQSTT